MVMLMMNKEEELFGQFLPSCFAPSLATGPEPRGLVRSIGGVSLGRSLNPTICQTFCLCTAVLLAVSWPWEVKSSRTGSHGERRTHAQDWSGASLRGNQVLLAGHNAWGKCWFCPHHSPGEKKESEVREGPQVGRSVNFGRKTHSGRGRCLGNRFQKGGEPGFPRRQRPEQGTAFPRDQRYGQSVPVNSPGIPYPKSLQMRCSHEISAYSLEGKL